MTLAINITNFATRVATEAKTLRTLINGNQADNAALLTTAKGNLVAAINELYNSIDTAGAQINDAATATGTVWSSTKTQAQINAATSALVDAAPGTLDTLNELAAALGDDPAFTTTITTALGNRVRFDAAQTLTAPQQTQARANIGAAPVTHTHTASQITDASVIGRTVLTAATAAAILTAIGAESAADVGDTETDFVATFNAGLV